MKSSFPPKKFREIVVQILYSLDADVLDREELISLLMAELKVAKTQVSSAYEMAELIFEKREELDLKITQVSASYNFERIGKVEKNILRLAARDFFEQVLPKEVIIAEAIRLTRKFSTDSSATFVQAIANALIGTQNTGIPHDAPLSPC